MLEIISKSSGKPKTFGMVNNQPLAEHLSSKMNVMST